jgi:cell division protein FtsZ
VDFADVRAIMRDAGTALMGIGRGTGESRAVDAAKMAIDSPLLEVSIDGARGILYTITASPNMSMNEVSEASRVITASADPNAKIIFGAVIDENLKDEFRVTVVATGFSGGTSKSSVRAQEMAPARSSPQGGFSKPQPQYPQSSRSVFQEQRPPSHQREEEPKKEDAQEDELEIPAFIRKKMM